MRRREFLGALAGSLPALRAQTGGKTPNIVLILADDLGWSDTTPYGADLHETPNLERLAQSGVRFTRAYSAGPVCSPTRASIQTGKHPARLHITIWREAAHAPSPKTPLIPPAAEENLPSADTTIAEALHDATYLTAHVGKWHLGNAASYPEVHGYDINIGGTEWGAPQTYFYPFTGNKLYGGEFRYVPGLCCGKPGDYLTDRLTDKALEVIDTAAGRPFFLNLCFHTPHTPIEGKPEYVEYFKAKQKPGQRHKNATYAAMVRSLDENVGRVLDHLDRRGLAANTVVVFTSDNGGLSSGFQKQMVTDNYPLRSGKGSLYEGGIRVPLIVRWPGVTPAGKTCADPVYSCDLYPTLIETVGLKPAAGQGIDGRSLEPLLRNPSSTLGREDLFFHYPHYYATTTPVSAILSRDYKLLRYYEDGRQELYNLNDDPGETRDLAATQPDIRDRLADRLTKWLESVNAQFPSKRAPA